MEQHVRLKVSQWEVVRVLHGSINDPSLTSPKREFNMQSVSSKFDKTFC